MGWYVWLKWRTGMWVEYHWDQIKSRPIKCGFCEVGDLTHTRIIEEEGVGRGPFLHLEFQPDPMKYKPRRMFVLSEK